MGMYNQPQFIKLYAYNIHFLSAHYTSIMGSPPKYCKSPLPHTQTTCSLISYTLPKKANLRESTQFKV